MYVILKWHGLSVNKIMHNCKVDKNQSDKCYLIGEDYPVHSVS